MGWASLRKRKRDHRHTVNGTAVTVDSALAANITANTAASFSKTSQLQADVYKNVRTAPSFWVRRSKGDAKTLTVYA